MSIKKGLSWGSSFGIGKKEIIYYKKYFIRWFVGFGFILDV